MRLPEEQGLIWNVIAVYLRTHILQVHPRSADHGHLNGQVTAAQMWMENNYLYRFYKSTSPDENMCALCGYKNTE